MSDELQQLAALQQQLGAVLTAADPAARCRELLPEIILDADGLRVACLLIAKLRFQRLVAASRDAMQWFERDPAAFAAAFRHYHATTPTASLDIWAEAEAWSRYTMQL